MGRQLTAMYRALGYASRAAMLQKHGFEVGQNKGGRPKTIDPEALIKELQKRYSDQPASSLGAIIKDNPDLSFKTVQNLSMQLFGKTFSKQLEDIGVLEASIDHGIQWLDEMVTTLRNRYDQQLPLMMTLKEIGKSNPDISISKLQALSKAKYNKSALDYLMECGILTSEKHVQQQSKRADLDNLLSILRQRYATRLPLDFTMIDLLSENPDLPLSDIDGWAKEAYALSGINLLCKEGILTPASVALSKKSKGLKQTALYTLEPSDLNVQDVQIPDGVTHMVRAAFANQTQLHQITLPDSMVAIAPLAFHNCSTLHRLCLPDGLKRISEKAFSGCLALEVLYLPASLEFIDQDSFAGCDKLFLHVQTDSYAAHWAKEHAADRFCFASGQLLYQVDKTGSANIIGGRNVSSTLELPERIDGIKISKVASDAFDGYPGLKTLLVPEALMPMVSKSMEMRPRLEVLTLDRTFDSMSDAYNSSLETQREGMFECMLLPDGGVSIQKYLGSDSALTVPETIGQKPVRQIAANAFYHQNGLFNMTLPSTLETIGHNAFAYCQNLRSIVLPDSLSEIGHAAFCGCKRLESVSLPAGLTNLGRDAFKTCLALASITLPKSLHFIQGNPFTHSAPEVLLPPEHPVLEVKDGVLFDTSSQTLLFYPILDEREEYEVPAGTQSIADHAFFRAKHLKRVTFPEGLLHIGTSAFESCTQLQEVYLPDSLKNLGDSAFSGCSSLASVWLPKDIRQIGNWVFQGCEKLNRLDLPAQLESIGDFAFARCIALVGVSIPKRLRHIGDAAFWNCCRLERLELPAALQTIGENAFTYCIAISRLHLPSSIQSIGTDAFRGCLLMDLQVYSDSFAHQWAAVNRVKHSTLPPKARPDTTAAPAVGKAGPYTYVLVSNHGVEITGYTGHDSVLTLPDSLENLPVLGIGRSAFSAHNALRAVTLPQSLLSIGHQAFASCLRLETVALPQNLQWIGSGAFEQCVNLSKVILPESLKLIGSMAFYATSLQQAMILPLGMQAFNYNAFRDCKNLRNILVDHAIASVFIGHAPTKIGTFAAHPDAFTENASKSIDSSNISPPAATNLIKQAIVHLSGTQYANRTQHIEDIQAGDLVVLRADFNNPHFSPVAIEAFDSSDRSLGYISEFYGVPASLEEMAAQLDRLQASVHAVTPLSKRSSRARSALLEILLTPISN